MQFKYIVYSCLIKYAISDIPTSIYQKINEETPYIYTIQSNNLPIKNISEYTNSDLDIFQLKLDTNMNMFSLFTKNYFLVFLIIFLGFLVFLIFLVFLKI